MIIPFGLVKNDLGLSVQLERFSNALAADFSNSLRASSSAWELALKTGRWLASVGLDVSDFKGPPGAKAILINGLHIGKISVIMKPNQWLLEIF